MNYLYDKDNSIIALAELALHKKYGEEYSQKSSIIHQNPNSAESKGIIKSLIDTQYENVLNKISGAIVLAYERSKIKLHQDIGQTNLAISHDNLNVAWAKFGELKQPSMIDSNYMPKSSTLVQNLKPGDIVFVPVENIGKGLGPRTVQEMFYDSYVDVKGKTIIRTLVKTQVEDPLNPGKTMAVLQTRKRVASKFDQKGNLIETNAVDARIQNSDIHDLFSYDETTKYESIDTKVKDGYMTFQSTLDLLKSNPKTKVVIDKISHKIKYIQGSTIMIDYKGGVPMNISDINKIEYPLDPSASEGQFEKLNEEDIKNNPNWTKFSRADIGEHIAFKKGASDKELTEGIVVAVGKRGDNKIIYYKTSPKAAEGKLAKSTIGYITESNVRYVSSPTQEYHISLDEQSQVNDFVGNYFLNEKGQPEELITVFSKSKPGSFKELDYSVSQINKYSKISPKDILYDVATKATFKVVHSGLDFIKATRLVDNDIRYWSLQKEDLSSFLLFSKSPINESFANSHIRKNSANLYAEQRDGSVEATVWRNYNGFTYSLPKRLTLAQFENHPLFERRIGADGKIENPIDVTQETIKELGERYKWDMLPNTLYMKFGEDGKSIYKNTENTVRIPMNNENFKNILNNLETLQTYLVPGTFIQFKGNSDSFIIEKVYKDHIELGSYHHTLSANESIKDQKLKYVKAEKFFLNKESLDKGVEIVNLYLPKWATASYDNLSQYKTITDHKDSKLTKYSVSDSIEIIGMLADVVKSKYNTDITLVHTHDLHKFGNPELFKSAAFATKDGIYINIDKASIEEPVHEVLHLIMATMKASDPETYYRLVNSVQYHPLFNEISKVYDEINTEKLEETFIKLLSKTFRQNILKEGVYTEPAFNKAMKQSISDLMDLTEDLSWEDSFEMLGKPINDVLFDFGSKLVDNEESLIDRKSVSYMFDISGKIKTLLDEGKLEQKCSY